MKQERISAILEQLDPQYIEEALSYAPANKPRPVYKYCAIAACFVLFIASCVWFLWRPTAPDPQTEIQLAHNEPIESPSTQAPTASTAHTEASESTEPSSLYEPSGPEPVEDPSEPEPIEDPPEPQLPDDPPPPSYAEDPAFLNFVTEEPISFTELPSPPSAGGDSYIWRQLYFSPALALESHQGRIYPLYADPYPYDETGPLFAVTEDFLVLEQRNLQTYMTLLLGEGEYTGKYDQSVSHKLFYEGYGLSLIVGERGVHITSSEYGLYPELTREDLAENSLIRAALSYCSIDTPVIIREVEYNIHGEEQTYIYTLTQATADPFTELLSYSYSYVTVRSFAEEEGSLLLVSAVRDTELYEQGIATIATREEVERYVHEAYPELADHPHVVELYYSSKVLPGYRVPCYRVIFTEEDLSKQYGVPVYTLVDLTDARFLHNADP
ncbi:MAG: hypothetical protein IKT58_05560 [Oscillospiraceae bacterium]|nr:hypothetical protein [Oscillospiraceae bacterium]